MKKIAVLVTILLVISISNSFAQATNSIKNLINQMTSNSKKKGVTFFGPDSLAAKAGYSRTKVILKIKDKEYQISFDASSIKILSLKEGPSIFIVDKDNDGKVDFMQYNAHIIFDEENKETAISKPQAQQEYEDILKKLQEFYNK